VEPLLLGWREDVDRVVADHGVDRFFTWDATEPVNR
jgi:hypothetical protein